ncbi:MAG TPA: lysyl oxidase family protein [Polyangiaceae bacterium]|nr:lysyl oxidase family protein [Polyangiaceae bacterium]
MRTRSTLVSLLSTLVSIFLVALALVGVSCGSAEPNRPVAIEPLGPSFIELGDVTVSAAPRVAPLAAYPVTVTARNRSNGTLEPGEVELHFRGDAAWGDAPLTLTAPVPAGEVATFRAELVAPTPGRYELAWRPERSGRGAGAVLAAKVEVTCSDGVFCNGAERFARGACVAGSDPCDDGEACTADACDEATGTCSHVLGAGCAACFSECVPDCTGRVCGSDGCGGSCGACAPGEGCASIAGTCQSAAQPGTCANPLPLLGPGEALLGAHAVAGDTTAGLHQAVPTCNSTSTAVEIVYTFTTTERVGLDARASGFDTVLHLRKAAAAPDPSLGCLDDRPEATVKCSDDAAPPGDYGSRLAAALEPGTYYLIVDGFDSEAFGPFTLTTRFVKDGCVPNCDGRYCGGDDGCGGDCGACDPGFKCSNRRCLPDPCTPDCAGKECGDDGCDGSCGACPAGLLCVPSTSTCRAFPSCDHDRPVCEGGCGPDAFCGTDCACHPLAAPMPDLVLDADRLASEILFEVVDISPDSCAIVEDCVAGPGRRTLLRFSVEAVNQGQATLVVPPPADRPDLFLFSPCHGHYHFDGFATYGLLDLAGNTVIAGRKQAYCMEDTAQVIEGPGVACEKKYSCEEQGIQPGWSDLYGNALDCQWLDITDLAPGDYQIEVALNPARAFEEVSFENNVARVPVTIPPGAGQGALTAPPGATHGAARRGALDQAGGLSGAPPGAGRGKPALKAAPPGQRATLSCP